MQPCRHEPITVIIARAALDKVQRTSDWQQREAWGTCSGFRALCYASLHMCACKKLRHSAAQHHMRGSHAQHSSALLCCAVLCGNGLWNPSSAWDQRSASPHHHRRAWAQHFRGWRSKCTGTPAHPGSPSRWRLGWWVDEPPACLELLRTNDVHLQPSAPHMRGVEGDVAPVAAPARLQAALGVKRALPVLVLIIAWSFVNETRDIVNRTREKIINQPRTPLMKPGAHLF
jgi:hypothetical protein